MGVHADSPASEPERAGDLTRTQPLLVQRSDLPVPRVASSATGLLLALHLRQAVSAG